MKNPLSFLRRKPAAAKRGGSLFHALRARFAAANFAASERGVSYSEALCEDSDANPETRRRLRVLSRYELRHNSYARGIAQTLANDSVSCGPRLRFAAADEELAAAVEHYDSRECDEHWCGRLLCGSCAVRTRGTPVESDGDHRG